MAGETSGMGECQHVWHDAEVGCEDCGDHPAVACDGCGEVRDLVWNEDPRDEEERSE